MAKMNKLATSLMVGSLLVASIQPSVAATEYDESDFGNPGQGRMIADTFVGKPLQLINAIGSSFVYVVSAPFAKHSGNLAQTRERLVEEPWKALKRCHGCTVAEDKFIKSQQMYNQQGISFVVNEPSRVTIQSNGSVVVDDYTGTTSQ